MFLYLDSLSVDTDQFLRSLGVDPQIVKSPDGRIPVETYLLIQDEAAAYVNDPYFGLHMGEYHEPGSWSILGYMMMNCKTLGEAFEKSARYSRLIGNLIETSGDIQEDRIKLVFSTPPHAPRMSRHCFEATFASTVRMMHTLTGIDLSPLEVRFSDPEPESTAEYRRIFRCPVYFSQQENSFTIATSVIFTPVLLPNPDLLEYFENYAQEVLVELDRKTEHSQKVTRIILSQLDDESLTLDKVASEMAVSVRTLQNRLKDEGVVFSQLLKEVREKLAKKYLREDYTVEDITYLLGFSEPSVFRKAFKRWVGITPGQFRQGDFSAMQQLQ